MVTRLTAWHILVMSRLVWTFPPILLPPPPCLTFCRPIPFALPSKPPPRVPFPPPPPPRALKLTPTQSSKVLTRLISSLRVIDTLPTAQQLKTLIFLHLEIVAIVLEGSSEKAVIADFFLSHGPDTCLQLISQRNTFEINTRAMRLMKFLCDCGSIYKKNLCEMGLIDRVGNAILSNKKFYKPVEVGFLVIMARELLVEISVGNNEYVPEIKRWLLRLISSGDMVAGRVGVGVASAIVRPSSSYYAHGSDKDR